MKYLAASISLISLNDRISFDSEGRFTSSLIEFKVFRRFKELEISKLKIILLSK
jgi:hypothetical protein